MRSIAPRLLTLLALGPLSCRSESGLEDACAPRVLISEVAAANEAENLADHAFCAAAIGPTWCCEQPDWVEILNAGETAADLSGYSVYVNRDSEGIPFPDGTILEAGEHLIVDMSPIVPTQEEDAQSGCIEHLGGRAVHGGIDLNRDGDRVVLYSRLGEVCGEVPYPDQHADFSWSRIPDAGKDFCFGNPTPLDDNESAHPMVTTCRDL